ncbi:D-lactate dehydrogenase [Ulvibacter sp. MAR_2010_11]|uniref:NAD(P)-dependent oxidoreductase n=1 Tax=Ulvibacter sp. MAR_2010_11 TaxID=1250229 RepID=UPI000C2C46A3|nr:NAD(P)-dependent oxidoreductase [Ulvibacter sp. MAR_2010_11]PKA84483.1 D-lactate dehydrogenase [Ulvibacter sp. MAR_2010_11]
MKVLIYSTKPFEIPLLELANNGVHDLHFTEKRLTSDTAMLALNYNAISIFSADDASNIVLEKLRDFGVKYITLRSAGHDNINLKTAGSLGFKVANSPNYSPNAIAEHAIALLLSFNRKIALAQNQTLNNNFLLDNLIGFDLIRKTVGVMGTGKIGSVLVKILHGFGCTILANDISSNEQLVRGYGVVYSSKEQLSKEAEIIFICLPLNQITHHMFDEEYLSKFRKKPIIVNVARGAIVKTNEILKALDTGIISGYITDVYEREHGVFFYNRSSDIPNDPTLHHLIRHPKTLVTPHQAFATNEALQNIASATFDNLNAWENDKHSVNKLV